MYACRQTGVVCGVREPFVHRLCSMLSAETKLIERDAERAQRRGNGTGPGYVLRPWIVEPTSVSTRGTILKP
jgi:hypothetical protein